MIAYTRIQMLLVSLRQYNDVMTRNMGLSEESLRTHAAFLYIALGTGECNAADDVIQSLRPTQYIAKPPTPSYQYSDYLSIYLRCSTKHFCAAEW